MKRWHSRGEHNQLSSILPGTPCASNAERTVSKRLAFMTRYMPHPCPSVLDMGCGWGVYLQPLSAYSALVVGADINYEYLREAAANSQGHGVYLLQMDVEKLAFAKESMDAVTMIEVLEHLRDGTRAIQQVSAILKPGGCLLMSVPNKLFLFETHGIRVRGKLRGSRWGTGIPFLPLLPRRLRKRFATVQLYYAWELKKMLEAKGFSVCKIDFLMPSLDALQRHLPGSVAGMVWWANRTLGALEKSALRIFGSTILVCAMKV